MKKLLFFFFVCSTVFAASPFGNERIVLHTIAGDIVLGLFPDKAPRHVEQLLRLARLGAYDTTHFYRLEPGFVLQTSLIEDRTVPAHPDLLAQARPLPLEISDLKHEQWVLSMARQDNDPNSATSSFSILLGNAPHLDGKYTIFGQVIDGFDVIAELLKAPLNQEKRPGVRLNIQKAEVLTAREIASRTLAPAVELFRPAPVPVPLLIGIGLLLCISLAAFIGRSRLTPQQFVSLHILNVLVAAFLLFTALTRQFNTHPWLGGALSICLYLCFWLVGRFEGPRPARTP
ncbi:MAG: peptidylprolyl isomerase [Bdellovibrionaceae bacterium]|nr:peptidylprolyl isomerase [Bdellovibrionales bacterium]MCB9254255.1 peptidylprolyl isomerase [Pseudobdellovibrionaceae bacterium]